VLRADIASGAAIFAERCRDDYSSFPASASLPSRSPAMAPSRRVQSTSQPIISADFLPERVTPLRQSLHIRPSLNQYCIQSILIQQRSTRVNAPEQEPRNNNAQPSKRRYFERPDPHEKPLTLMETFFIVISSHLGVRTREKLQDDFRRANGMHLFVAGIVYFALMIAGLVALVIYISG
jgi:hypothetical protein